ncbi:MULTISPECIES: group I truncated hemoglobin [Streptomyces]|uniref:Group 1 truncated hemoglobin n=1 Tax=Streptomyces ardesiacus TaxID=285564 RepID=A0ABW8HL07_9ACTN|nr:MULTISPECIES: group 1 truncated hemoglobin [Streptomyces]KOT98790.1 hemin receptor [Streptomyces sp. NRRL F-4711]KOX31178.1 hemin receptor [Streptomyces sp. NRRL F-4707]KOX46604.1 hemin receptor [Streptomyces sp. NRRL F-7442]MCL7369701.1 group 1 truncated hemoglobin [Streptomyces ardesiacus]
MTDTISGTPSGAPSPTLFEQLGGEDAVGAVVDIFYDKVLGDPDLQPYFTGVDLDRLKQHQRRFIGQALGATRPYSGRSMRKAHEHLAITDDAFGKVVDHLAGALTEAGVDEATIGTIAQALLPLKADIVTA